MEASGTTGCRPRPSGTTMSVLESWVGCTLRQSVSTFASKGGSGAIARDPCPRLLSPCVHRVCLFPKALGLAVPRVGFHGPLSPLPFLP